MYTTSASLFQSHHRFRICDSLLSYFIVFHDLLHIYLSNRVDALIVRIGKYILEHFNRGNKNI